MGRVRVGLRNPGVPGGTQLGLTTLIYLYFLRFYVHFNAQMAAKIFKEQDLNELKAFYRARMALGEGEEGRAF